MNKQLKWSEMREHEKAYFKGLVKVYIGEQQSCMPGPVSKEDVKKNYKKASALLNTDEPELIFS